MTDIKLKQAEAKFTKAKAALDGTPAKEKAYQKAKQSLAAARQAWRQQGRPRPQEGDSTATLTSLKAQAQDPKGRN
jgi:hypothetical protein